MAVVTTVGKKRGERKQHVVATGLLYVVLMLGTVVFLGPMVWALLTSLKPEDELFSGLFPSQFTLDAYTQSFTAVSNLGRAFANSVFCYGAVTVGVLVFSSMAGYALARLDFVGRSFLFNLILFTMTIPAMLTLVPLYILVANVFGWSDSYLGIIAPAIVSTLAIFWFRQFFRTLPVELFEAGRIDGLSDLDMLFRIAWPLSKGVVLMVAVLTFMNGWNDLLWPLVVLHDQNYHTAAQAVALFVISGQGGAHVTWQLAMAVVLAAPIVAAYIVAQKHIVEGIATTGIK
jgi:multiple sugar transport system permease protein